MKIRTSCLLVLTVLLAGCWQKSVHPFYTEKDVIFDPQLAGTWTEGTESDGNRTTWTFTNMGGRRFDAVMQDKDTKYEFRAIMFKLGEERFLDFEGKSRDIGIIPSHHLLRMELGAELKLATLNPDWMEKWLRANPGTLAHFALEDAENRNDRDKDQLVLSADTKALQKFILAHKDDKEFFVEPVILKK
jgi:hypothetical protein